MKIESVLAYAAVVTLDADAVHQGAATFGAETQSMSEARIASSDAVETSAHDYLLVGDAAFFVSGDSLSQRASGEMSVASQSAVSDERIISVEAETGQEENAEADEERRQDRSSRDEIVVVGSNIRGIALDSSPTFVFDREEIEKSGFLSTEQFFRSIPQTFGGGVNSSAGRGFPLDLESRSNSTTAAGINLRGLGVDATLTLLNGRRLAPAGTTGGFVDVSAIPISAIERIEVMTDGASSIYGGDAVSGVVNFTVRDDFEGAETRIDYGFVTEGDLNQIRASQTAGASWESGNALVSYEFFDQDILFASEKEFAQEALPLESLLPEQQRHSVIAVLSQSLTDSIQFKANGFYANRDSFRFDNSEGRLRERAANTEQFLISSSLSYELGRDWRVVLGGDYSETNTDSFSEIIIVATGMPLPSRAPVTNASQASVDLLADGSLFELGGGLVKVAIGAAYRDEDFAVSGPGAPDLDGDRRVWAAFGELFLPFFSEQNRLPGIERLEINASVRHDDYSDFGGSVNPKVGVLWSPLPDLRLRGTYSTSFNPPVLGVSVDTRTNATAGFATNPLNPPVRDIPYLVIGPGSVPDLQAENSRAFTAGLDYDFDLGGGRATFSSTYYNIDFEDRIGPFPRPPGFRGNSGLALFLDLFPAEIITLNPSLEETQGFIDFAEASGGEVVVADGVDLSNIEILADFRTRNLRSAKTEGIDFQLGYNIETNIGAFNASFNANHIIDFTKQSFPTAPVVETLNRPFDPVDLRLRGSLGWAFDGWRITSFINYTDGYTEVRNDPDTPIDSWTTADLNIGYDFGATRGASLLRNARVSMSILNLFDQDPPAVLNDAEEVGFSAASFDPANASPLGRFISFAITKKW